MVDPTGHAAQVDAAALLAELRAIRDLLARDPGQLLLSHEEAAALMGVSRSAWFRALADRDAPKAVSVPGTTSPRFRRRDVERFADKLPRAKARRPAKHAP